MSHGRRPSKLACATRQTLNLSRFYNYETAAKSSGTDNAESQAEIFRKEEHFKIRLELSKSVNFVGTNIGFVKLWPYL